MAEPKIYLTDWATGVAVEAELVQNLDREALEDTDTFWRVAAKRLSAKAGEKDHAHWDWAAKFDAFSEAGEFIAIERSGLMEGLMFLRFDKLARLATQEVYVDYLEVAPWNLAWLNPTPRYKGVGRLLFQVAREVSLERGWEGRVGLHSLPQAEGFYRHIGLHDPGTDVSYAHLRNFKGRDRANEIYHDSRRRPSLC